MKERLAPYSSWIWLGVALMAIGLVRLIAEGSNSMAPALASNSTSSDGGLALKIFLRKVGHQISVTSDDGNPCRGLMSHRDALVVAMHGADIPPQFAPQCSSWLRSGGTIVVASDGSTANDFLETFGLTLVPGTGDDVKVVQPVLMSPPVTSVDGSATAVIDESPSAIRPGVTVLESQTGPVLEKLDIHAGTLWLLSAPDVLQNDGLAQADNARVIVNMVPPNGRVRLEEYQGGAAAIGAARSNWLSGSVWGAALIFAFAVLLLYRGLTGVRLGPPLRSIRDTHRPASEYVVAMAYSLRGAGKRQEILTRYENWLKRTLRERHIDSNPTARAVALTAEATALTAPAAKLSDDEMLRRVQGITKFEDRLEKTRV